MRKLVRAENRFERHRSSIHRQFARLSDDRLRDLVQIPPSLEESVNSPVKPASIITPSVGLPELLKRVARLSGVPGEIRRIDQNVTVPESPEQNLMLFGYPTSVSVLQPIDEHNSLAVLAVVLRPGGYSLQLVGRLVKSRDQLQRALEDIIRDHIEQWTPSVLLWGNPIEELDAGWLDVSIKRSS